MPSIQVSSVSPTWRKSGGFDVIPWSVIGPIGDGAATTRRPSCYAVHTRASLERVMRSGPSE